MRRKASLAQVGDRDRSGNAEENENLNFPPKIVRYYGMTALDGHPWGWPSYDSQYPKIAFHDPQGNSRSHSVSKTGTERTDCTDITTKRWSYTTGDGESRYTCI